MPRSPPSASPTGSPSFGLRIETSVASLRSRCVIRFSANTSRACPPMLSPHQRSDAGVHFLRRARSRWRSRRGEQRVVDVLRAVIAHPLGRVHSSALSIPNGVNRRDLIAPCQVLFSSKCSRSPTSTGRSTAMDAVPNVPIGANERMIIRTVVLTEATG